MKLTGACTMSLLLIFLVPAALFSQATLDPNDRIYGYINAWDGRGYFEALPKIRPYSAEMLRSLLALVIEHGNTEDMRLAREFLAELSRGSVHVYAGHESDFKDSTYAGSTYAGIKLFGQLAPFASIAATFNAWLLDGAPQSIQPVGERWKVDLLSAQIPVSILGHEFDSTNDSTASLALGNDTFSFQTGLTRVSFGPFFDNGVVMGPQAPLAPNAYLNWKVGPISLFEGFFSLLPQTPAYPSSQKYVVTHGLEFQPASWVSFGIFETVVYAGRFDPIYLIPAAELVYLQGLRGWSGPDTSFVGLDGTVRILPGLVGKALVYIDDIGLGELFKLDFNTMYKLAAEAGISWAPESTVVRSIALDYTIVTSYCYTHPDAADYTNAGVNEGPALQPDSDRIEVRAFLTPLEDFELEPLARMIRHGNASDGIPGGGDGSIFDTGFINGIPTFEPPYQLPPGLSYPRLLTQSVIDTSFQVGSKAAYRIATSWGTFRLWARYLFEVRLNEGLIAGNTGIHNYVTVGAEYQY